jgi:hypothetical protein
MADNITLPAFGETLAADDIGGIKHQRMKMQFGADGAASDVSSSNPLPVTASGAELSAMESLLASIDGLVSSLDARIPASPAVDRTNDNAPNATRLSNGTTFLTAFETAFAQASTTFTQAGVITINTVLLTLDLQNQQSASIHCVAMGTTGVVTPEWSNDNTNWSGANLFTALGAAATTFNAAGLWVLPRMARYLRLRLSTATTAATTTIVAAAVPTPFAPWFATQSISGTVNSNSTAVASTARMGFAAGAGIWFDDSSTNLAANATFTGTSRDLAVSATGAAFANAATYAKELRVSAESDVTGTLWLEVSRDNTNWRRVKSVATAAVTGGGFYAEIVHAPSWRYARVGFTNGAGAQARFTIGSILTAL